MKKIEIITRNSLANLGILIKWFTQKIYIQLVGILPFWPLIMK